MLIIITYYFYYQRHKITCPCTHFINKKQLKSIKTYLQRIWKISVLEWKQTKPIKARQMSVDIFQNQNLFVLIYSYLDDNLKMKYYLPKGIINNYNFTIKRENFYDQSIDSNIKRYQKIRKINHRMSQRL